MCKTIPKNVEVCPPPKHNIIARDSIVCNIWGYIDYFMYMNVQYTGKMYVPRLSWLVWLCNNMLYVMHKQAVPAYIQKVNWGSLLETLEVYSLLEEIHDTKDNFPVEVS